MECRYVGQGFELRAAMPAKPLTRGNVKTVIDNFFDAHKQQYGHAFKDQVTEAITVRVVASADVEKLKLRRLPKGSKRNPKYARLYDRKTVFDNGKSVSTPRYDRDKLRAGDVLAGPALVTQHNSTTIIPPGYNGRVLAVGDILIGKK